MSWVAKKERAIYPEKKSIGRERIKTSASLRISEPFIILCALLILFCITYVETKATKPEFIPISETEETIRMRLFIAENTPKSSTDKPLAAISVKRKAKKAERMFPIKRTYVSLAVPEKARALALSKYALILKF